MQLRCVSLSITTPVSNLANEFDVRSELHGKVSLAAVNQILCRSRGYERLQNSKDSLKVCFENVNIITFIEFMYCTNNAHVCGYRNYEVLYVYMSGDMGMVHFESNYTYYYSNYSLIRTSKVATIVLLEINGGSEHRYSSRLSGSLL